MNDSNKNFHDDILKLIKTINGITEINDYYENPDRYGNIVSCIYFKYNYKDKYNYTIGEFNIHYKDSLLFIPEYNDPPKRSPYILIKNKTVNDVFNIIKERFNFK